MFKKFFILTAACLFCSPAYAEETQLEKDAEHLNVVPIEVELKGRADVSDEADSIAYGGDKKQLREIVKNNEMLKEKLRKRGAITQPPVKIDTKDREAVKQYLIDESLASPDIPADFYDKE